MMVARNSCDVSLEARFAAESGSAACHRASERRPEMGVRMRVRKNGKRAVSAAMTQ
jgi:hypothetical protein